jgi:hypothetical protein
MILVKYAYKTRKSKKLSIHLHFWLPIEKLIWKSGDFLYFQICQIQALLYKGSMSIFFSKISPLCFKISYTTHSKDFCEKSVPNPLDLEDFFVFPEIAIF